MTGLAIVIPAAGRGARMRGRDKLLEVVEGQPLLTRQARMAAGLGVPVLVTLPEDRPARAAALAGLEGVETRVLAGAAEGMAASLRTGAAWAGGHGADGLMVVLPDMPDLGQIDLKKVSHAAVKHPEYVIQAVAEGDRAGHPVVLPARLFARIQGLRGDTGARAVIAAERIVPVPLPGRRAITDLDTPEDWAAWRARAGETGG